MTITNTQNVPQATSLSLDDLTQVKGGMGALLGGLGPLVMVAILERVKEIADKQKETAK